MENIISTQFPKLLKKPMKKFTSLTGGKDNILNVSIF